MLRSSFNGTTSRRALISGMTNTDQVGMWQAGPATAEKLPDTDTGGEPDGGGGEERDPNTGLTASEQAEFDAMRTGDPAPGDGNDPGDDGDVDAEPDAAVGDGSDDADPREPRERAPSDKDPAAQNQRTPKTVNYSKYQRELKRANEALAVERAEKQKLRDDSIKLGERVRMIDEALRQQQAPPAQQQDEPEAPQNPFEEADIDPNEDYAGAVQQERRRNHFVYAQNQQTAQTFQETANDAQTKDTFERDFRAYAGTEEGKSIPQAYQFLKDSRLTEICITEFNKDPNDPNEQFTPQEVQRMVNLFNQEEKWVVSEAIKAKRSPAAAIMRLARARGFKPLEAPPARQQAPQPPAQRQRVPLAPQQQEEPRGPTASQQLAQLRQQRDDGRSLSDGGGAPPEGLTAEMILRLGDDEFAEMVDGMSKHQLDALMGRSLT